MTAVIRLAFDNRWPVLVGDLLVSGAEKPREPAHLPTIEDLADIFPEGSAKVPRMVKQKIAVISDNLVIGWSGDYRAATTVIRDLCAKSLNEPFTKESLSDYFESVDQEIWAGRVGFLGFITDAQHPNSIGFGYGHEALSTSLFGEVGILGTGRGELEDLVGEFSELPKDRIGNPNVLMCSLGFGLSLSGTLLTRELATFESLRNLYGGGYEIASYIEGKFQKLDDITYVFWNALITDRGVQIDKMPHHVLCYAYSDDILRIRSVSCDVTQDPVSYHESGHIATPIYRDVLNWEISTTRVPALNNKWQLNYFVVTPRFGERKIYARVDFRDTDDRNVRFLEDKENGITGLDVNEGFIKSIADDIWRRFNKGG